MRDFTSGIDSFWRTRS